MRLLFVADEIPAELLRIVEFLNERMSPTEVLALELRYFSGGGYSTHIPRVLGRTLAAVTQKEISGARTNARRVWTREDFLADLQIRTDGEIAGKIAAFLAACESQFEVTWGTGAQTGSFTPRRSSVSARGPISVFSDGRLDIKSSWLNDSPAAIAWRDRIKPRLESMGWQQAINSEREVTLTVPAAEWLPRAEQLFAAIAD